MRKKRKIEITFETDEVFFVKSGVRSVAPVWCDACGAQAEMIAPELAARLAGVSPRTIYGWIEEGRLHFSETPDRTLLVCLNSLPH